MRLTAYTDYTLRTLMYLGMHRDRLVTIQDIASHWGFWHLGQFAQDYRHLFGELPSDTLHKR